MHSQKLSATPRTPWAIIQSNGKVLAAHCNCMAGLGEACTHIASMLFSIEATVKVRESKTVTESKAYWLPASVKGVAYFKIEDIDFTSAKTKKKQMDMQFFETLLPKRGHKQHKVVDKPSETDLDNFLQQLSLTGAKSAVLSLKTKYQNDFVPKALDKKFPQVLTEITNNDLFSANFGDTYAYGKTVTIAVTSEEAACVEVATRKQSETKLWHRFRSGRITASRMYAVCHSSPAAPSESLIRTVCHPDSAKIKTAAINWGCQHEKDGRAIYTETMQTLHENPVVQDVGFTINPDYPLFGASPDAQISYDCCGQGVVEIKCPFCVRNSTLDTYSGPKSCLEETPHGKTLKKNHPYFYQVQTQIHLCSKEYADFVVWTEKEVHIERILPDFELWEEITRKASDFHSMAIMPELIGRFFSRLHKPCHLTATDDNNNDAAACSPLTATEDNYNDACSLLTATKDNNNDACGSVGASASDSFCFCRKGETDTMVACDNQNCKYQWFHLQCLKLTKSKLPKGKWYCPDCRQLPEYRSKRKCVTILCYKMTIIRAL